MRNQALKNASFTHQCRNKHQNEDDLADFPPGYSWNRSGVVESVVPVGEEVFSRQVLMSIHSAPPEFYYEILRNTVEKSRSEKSIHSAPPDYIRFVHFVIWILSAHQTEV